MPQAVGTRRMECVAATSKTPAPAGSTDHKLLPHSDCQRSFGTKDDKRLVPMSHGHLFGARVKRGGCFWLLRFVRAACSGTTRGSKDNK